MSWSPSRRRFLHRGMLAAAATALPWRSRAAESTVILPFANGERPLMKFPQKRPLILHTQRPPQLETPFEVFNEGLFTPNDAFFVRYHLAGLPLSIDAETYRLKITGEVEHPLSLSLEALRKLEAVEVAAVNQCAGNSRGFFETRVGGGQWGHGAMGNARWKGVRLSEVLAQAGLKASAKQVTFDGLDAPVLPQQTPDYVKSLGVEQAMDGECLLAYEMNGAPLPMLNGFPLRLVVPGYFATYWVKHLSEIKVIPNVLENFWMSSAYRVPDNPEHSIEPGTQPAATLPIGKMPVRSFITSHASGAHVRRSALALRGIAFDGGSGIKEVAISDDDGQSWKPAQLGKDYGPYSFREWTVSYQPHPASAASTLLCRAQAVNGEIQPMHSRWNPSGYQRNVVEKLTLTFA